MIVQLFILLTLVVVVFCLPTVVVMVRYRIRQRKGSRTMSTRNYFPRVSIVLPVYNEEKLIERKMENMLELHYPKDLLQIIVVDGNSDDRTVEIVSRFRLSGATLVEQKERNGMNEAVKLGVSVSAGEIVIMTDVEGLFHPDAIQIAVNRFLDPHVGGVSGHQVVVNPAENTVAAMESTYLVFHDALRLAESDLHSTSDLRGELCAFRRELFPAAMDPSKSTLDRSMDRAIAYNVIRNGKRAVCEEAAVFFDIAADKLRDRNRQKIQRAVLIQESLLQNLDMMLNPKFKAFGMLILPGNFFLYLLLPFVSLAWLLVAPFAIAALAWSSLTMALIVVTAMVLAVFSSRRGLLLTWTFLHSQLMLIIALGHIVFRRRPKLGEQVEGTRIRGWQSGSDFVRRT